MRVTAVSAVSAASNMMRTDHIEETMMLQN
jgi:hypothetical protein